MGGDVSRRVRPAALAMPASLLAAAELELRRGHAAEANGTIAGWTTALACYKQAAALLRIVPPSPEVRRRAAVAAMNRGNVLQKIAPVQNRAETVAAYDDAIALLSALPFPAHPELRNHLGAAWLNRGHALRQTGDAADLADALHSHRQAIAILRDLPLDAAPAYRVNLAGAWLNLADTLTLFADPAACNEALAAARHALALTASGETTDAPLGELALMARRAALIALGRLLASAEPDTTAALVTETGELVDSGVALARRWHPPAASVPTSLAVRLFRFGAEFYRRHQPQFLAEFLLENLDAPRGAPAAWASSTDLHAIARDALERAQTDLQAPRFLFAGDAATERILATRASLAAAAAFLDGHA